MAYLLVWLVLLPATYFACASAGAGAFFMSLRMVREFRGPWGGCLAWADLALMGLTAIWFLVLARKAWKYSNGMIDKRVFARAVYFQAALVTVSTALGVFSVSKGVPLYHFHEHNPGEETLPVIREALDDFKKQEGRYPESMEEFTKKESDNYFYEGLPPLRLDRIGIPHPESREVSVYPSKLIEDSGRWAYVNDRADPGFGSFYIDCSHADLRGRSWSAY